VGWQPCNAGEIVSPGLRKTTLQSIDAEWSGCLTSGHEHIREHGFNLDGFVHTTD
jgi:hypothetical protein